jgi:EAL domain-containing protein (putative c-di-GMP-specific phosphodiesterase class I)/ActR/RegA family two-component response regulator
MRAPTSVTTIVIAEDDPLVNSVLTDTVDSDSSMCVVASVTDAVSAVTETLALKPDLLLLDVEMPGGGGAAAARRISELCPTVCIVAISAHEDEEHVSMMLRAGATGYLTKNAPAAQVLDMLKRCARGETVFVPQSATEVIGGYAGVARAAEAAKQDIASRRDRLSCICNDGEISAVFQPVVNLISGEVLMIEALARFPENYGMNTSQWFDEANDLGMDAELEIAALRGAMSALDDNGYEGSRLSINLSPSTLLNPALAEIISGTDCGRLTIEITEHEPIEDYSAVRNMLAEYSIRGAQIAVDDVGAGFASLRHILALMPNVIKLDISITRDIHRDRARRALAMGLITFANEIGATIIAEGIENADEMKALRKIGVEFGQGFFMARPAAIESIVIDPAAFA